MKAALKDWRSTLTGIAILASGVTQIHGASDLTNQNVMTALIGGLGLILASFPTKKEVAK
jgi:hypothetical protein